MPAANPDARDDRLDLESQVCFALAVASRRVIALYRPLLEPMGLTHPQYLVMLALWQHERLNVRELSELVSLDSATLSPLVKRLAATGYLRKDRDPGDERSVIVSLTSRGRELRTSALEIPPAIQARLDIGTEDVERLHAVLTDVIRRTAPDGARG